MEAEIQRAPAYERSNFRSRLASLKRELDSTTAQVEQATRSISDLDVSFIYNSFTCLSYVIIQH